MRYRRMVVTGLVICCALGFGLTAALAGEERASKTDEKVAEGSARIDCEMTFTLKGWSAIYKTAKGEGTVTCDNGQSAKVKLKVTGGGLTFGKSEIVNGKGKFTDVRSMSDLYGAYAAGGAHAGVVKSAEASVMTKGHVSLALSGTGEGVDIGFDFSKFTIEKS